MKILESLHQIDGVNAGAFLLVDTTGLTLVDAGVPNAASKILSTIQALDYPPTALRHILLTHSDMDHVGGLSALVKASGARTYAETYEAEVIAGRQPMRGIKGPMRWVFRWLSPLFKMRAVQVSSVVRADDELPLHGGITVIASPGHTRGHVCYYWRAPKVLFVGDALVHGKQLKLSAPMFTWDLAQLQASIKRLATLDVEILCFGHGRPLIGSAQAQLKQLAATL